MPRKTHRCALGCENLHSRKEVEITQIHQQGNGGTHCLTQ